MLLKATSSKTTSDFLESSNKLAEKILQNRHDIVALLTQYETHDTADDEIERSVDALRGLKNEFSPIRHPLHGLTVSTFFPLNLPLYSLVLFGIAPSAFASHVYIRPPEVMNEILLEVLSLLDINKLFPNISIHEVPRYIFMDLYAKESDIIIFTGKYENALNIQKQCPQALLVYNGSGVNPFVLFENCDLDLAVKKAIEMRCFNSGQDCAGPDAFFVPTNLADAFVTQLQQQLSQIKVGDSKDPSVSIGRTIKDTYIQQLKSFMENEREHLVYGGKIDEVHHFAHPTIIRKTVSQHNGAPFHEFFAPFFYVLEYDRISELEKVLHSKSFIDRAMYISIFGDNPEVEKKLDFATILKNEIVNDVERGNHAYGGYGPNANFLLYGGEKIVHPILISRDIHKMLAT